MRRPIWIAQNHRMTLGVFCTMCLVLAIPAAQLPATMSKGLGYALAIAQNLLLAELWVRAYRWSIGTKARRGLIASTVAWLTWMALVVLGYAVASLLGWDGSVYPRTLLAVLIVFDIVGALL